MRHQCHHTSDRSRFVRYHGEIEPIAPGESEAVDQLLPSMHRVFDRDEMKFGYPMRVSHAKSHGVAVGELTVYETAPVDYRQGLFA